MCMSRSEVNDRFLDVFAIACVFVGVQVGVITQAQQ